MKTLLLVALAFVAGIITRDFSARENTRTRANAEKMLAETRDPQPARAAIPQGPPLHFIGKLSQHSGAGLLIECREWKPYLNKGQKPEAVTGSFFLVGHPSAKSLPDDAELEFYAQNSGMVEYTTVLGAKRTIRQIVYSGPAERR